MSAVSTAIVFSEIVVVKTAEESEYELGIVSGIIDTVKEHTTSLGVFREDHSAQASSINEKAGESFHQRYMVSESAT